MKPKESEQEKSAVMPKSLRGIVAARIKAVEQYDAIFQKTFGVRLSKYMHPVFGFDVVSFDLFIQPKDGESTKDKVQEKYGKEAVELILTLIKA